MKNIAIIPARSGSKRFPGKNLFPLGGLPLIEHSINYALDNKELFRKIIVTTNDLAIMEISQKKGVEVVERPSHLCSDTATTVSALKHVLESLNCEAENVILLQPTNPLRPDNLLREAYEKFQAGNYDSLMTVSRSSHKLGKIEDGKFVPFNYTIGQRSQDLEPLYYENGLLYIVKTSSILEEKLLGEKNYSFITNHLYSTVDIDLREDMEYAQFLMARQEEKFIK